MNANETIFGLEATKLKFGPHATKELHWEIERFQISRALLVIDPIHHSTGIFAIIESQFKKAQVEFILFDQIAVEPTLKSFQLAIEFASQHDFDGIVTVGGGSTMDTAKAINLLKVCGGEIMDYVNPPIGKGLKPKQKLLPLIALPTTAGTGSEATPVSVLDLPDLKVKTGISNPYLRPDIAIVDPELSKSAPSGVVASAGLDVICHAIESFIAQPYHNRDRPKHPSERPSYQGSNPISDLWSMKAIELGGKYFVRAVKDPKDIEARGYMMLAATLAGIGFGTAGVHIPHACSYPIAGLKPHYHAPGYQTPFVPHGFSVIVTSPAAFRFTYHTNPTKHIQAAELLNGSKIEKPGINSLPNAMIKILKQVDAPNGLKILGYSEQDLPDLVHGAMQQQRLLRVAPIPVTNSDLETILSQSFENW